MRYQYFKSTLGVRYVGSALLTLGVGIAFQAAHLPLAIAWGCALLISSGIAVLTAYPVQLQQLTDSTFEQVPRSD